MHLSVVVVVDVACMELCTPRKFMDIDSGVLITADYLYTTDITQRYDPSTEVLRIICC
jgi:hypothetical protein